MTRIDLLISTRILLVILVVFAAVFSLIYLGETLDLQRFDRIARTLGEDAAHLANLMAGAKWAIKALPVTVLIGSIIALIDLQSHREMLVAKVAGISVWRLIRGPIVVVILLALGVVFGLETMVTKINRDVNPTASAGLGAVEASSQAWLKQTGENGDYIMSASSATPDGRTLIEVTVIQLHDPLADRYAAERAEFRGGRWYLTDVTARSSLREARFLGDIELDSDSTTADLRLKLGSAEDLTFAEVFSLLQTGISDPEVVAAAQTRFLRLAAFPAVLVGVLFIAFAFTSGYKRTNSFGAGIGYGIIFGLLIFVISEMADRAGSAGVFDPTLAAWGPALAAFVIGATVLLHKEDGRV